MRTPLEAAARGRFSTRSVVLARNGMAATSQPLATQAALDQLKAGGSAVDAAIAANACLGLMEPVSCGIGGDLFAIVWDARTGRLHGLNASGRSARGATTDQVRARLRERGLTALPRFGALAGECARCG
jgi:gamma-glutamyltranspeptidase/glutathione hydrolase